MHFQATYHSRYPFDNLRTIATKETLATPMEKSLGILPRQVNNEDQEMLVRSFYGGGKSVFFIIIPQFHVLDAFP